MNGKKTIGILGGMGPLATADLFEKITLLTSISCTDLLGRIRAAAPMRPVSSSAAKRTFSISSVGSTSQQMP